MDIFDYLQLLGGIIITIGYIPQIKQILVTKSVEDINLNLYLMILLGVSLMEAYAVHLLLLNTGLMFFITNTTSVLFGLTMVLLIIKYKK